MEYGIWLASASFCASFAAIAFFVTAREFARMQSKSARIPRSAPTVETRVR